MINRARAPAFAIGVWTRLQAHQLHAGVAARPGSGSDRPLQAAMCTRRLGHTSWTRQEVRDASPRSGWGWGTTDDCWAAARAARSRGTSLTSAVALARERASARPHKSARKGVEADSRARGRPWRAQPTCQVSSADSQRQASTETSEWLHGALLARRGPLDKGSLPRRAAVVLRPSRCKGSLTLVPGLANRWP